MQVHTETDTGTTHTQPTLSDTLVNTAVQSEADTRLAVTHSGPGPALSLLGGGRGGASSGGRLGKGIPSGRPARVAESQRRPSRRPSPPPPPLPQVRSEPVTPRFHRAERGLAGSGMRRVPAPAPPRRVRGLRAGGGGRPCVRGLVFGRHVSLRAHVWPLPPRPARPQRCAPGAPQAWSRERVKWV